MSLDQLLNNPNLIDFFFKIFGIIFSFIYLLFSIVEYKQIQAMNKTLNTKWGKFIILVSFFQIMFALAVVALAFFII